MQAFWSETIVYATAEWDEVALDGFLYEQLESAGVNISPELQAIFDGGYDAWHDWNRLRESHD